jgi:hypothetical protein
MTLSDLASIGSLVSGLAVLVSLVYLSQQTRQNARHTRALIQQGRSDQYMSYSNTLATDPAMAEVFVRGSAGDTTMSDQQILSYFFLTISAIYSMEDLVHQHKDGLIDEDRHTALLAIAKRRLQSPGFRAVWQTARADHGPDYQEFIDTLIRDNPLTPPANIVANWKAALERGMQAG